MNYLSPNFIAETLVNGVSHDVDTGVPYAASTWYNFKIVLNNSNSLFYINGTLVATNPLPLGASGGNLGPYYNAVNQTGSGVVNRIDWLMVQTLIGSGGRGTF